MAGGSCLFVYIILFPVGGVLSVPAFLDLMPHATEDIRRIARQLSNWRGGRNKGLTAEAASALQEELRLLRQEFRRPLLFTTVCREVMCYVQ